MRAALIIACHVGHAAGDTARKNLANKNMKIFGMLSDHSAPLREKIHDAVPAEMWQ